MKQKIKSFLRRKALEFMSNFIIDDDVEWIVNDLGELGVKVGNRHFFLYKGSSMEYTEDHMEEDEPDLHFRPVGKREFGEVCYPIPIWEDGRKPDDYSKDPRQSPEIRKTWKKLPLKKEKVRC